jgi:Short C-terminal domain
MAGIGKKLTGMLGADQVDKLKNIGTEAISDILGNLTSNSAASNDGSDAPPPPPQGARVDDFAPPASAVIDTEPPKAPKPAASNSQTKAEAGSVADKIIALNHLRERGLLTDEEFKALKADLLS